MEKPVDQRAAELVKAVSSSQQPLPIAWNEALAAGSVGGSVLAEAFVQLHNAKKYDVAIEGIEAALRNDHAQPWMYDVLAMEMVLAERPQHQIDRVLASRVDFTGGDPAQMLVTAAIMARFQAFDRAIRICREVAMANPFQPAAWGMARRIADRSQNPEHLTWAYAGTIQNVWEGDATALHKQCVTVLEDLQQKQLSVGEPEAASKTRDALSAALSRDLQITVSWAGDADLDMIVFEPNQQRCSYKNRMTSNGGALVSQSEGGAAAARRGLQQERYVVSLAPNGEYKLRVRYISGRVIGGKARVEVVRYSGTPSEDRQTLTLPIGDTDPEVKIRLNQGRYQPK